jgi:cysteine-rich repeat protein
MRAIALIACAWALTAGCGDNLHPQVVEDAGVDAHRTKCGNGEIEPGEDCDDDDTITDVVCNSTCHFTCGDGVVEAEVGEVCDPGIATGPGACPTGCDDGQACTTDVLLGSACTAACDHAAITAPADGDGCCPAGANANTDSDCAPVCGNGVLETGEGCDPGITSGGGACPTACSDGNACTLDALVGGGTCAAMCTATPITAPHNNDGCCPAGADSTNDNDCVPACGNGIVNAGETCDKAILNGAGKCPTTCSDNKVCTTDVLANPGTCTAACTFPAITMAANGDGCCPAGANANTDNDCAPVCGNAVVESGEQCDDGNQDNTDACSNTCRLPIVVSAYRFSDMDLRDPHVFVNFLGCRDVTDTQLAGFSVNNALQTSIQTDGTDADTFLDLSIVTVFRPIDQANGKTTALEINFADCTSPLASTSCTAGASSTLTMATSQATGTCLAALAGTTHGYTPAIVSPIGSCYVSGTTTLTINLGGIPVTLSSATVAATYSGNPATTTVNGLVRGFISETDANNTIIPATFPLVGGQPLSALLPGGDPPGPNNTNCAAYSDLDINNGVRGWWFYLNFTAPKVTWVGP